MHKKLGWAPGLGVRVLEAVQVESRWIILARKPTEYGAIEENLTSAIL